MLRIGDKRCVTLRKERAVQAGPLLDVRATGEVIYIHPELRFAVLEFDFSPFGKFREAFHPMDLGETYD